MKTTEKKVIIMGATSGIGYEAAMILHGMGWTIGIAGRREEKLGDIAQTGGGHIHYRAIDICKDSAAQLLLELTDEMGGVDMYIHCSGIGKQNPDLNPEIEIDTLKTNGTGFARAITTMYNYFAERGHGHIAVISSIAGTKGLGIAPSYSATKRFQNTYIDALEQLSHIRHLDIGFTDIRPGFVATELLSGSKKYPMLMDTRKVAQSMVKAILDKKRVKVIDWRYSMLVAVWRLIPHCLWKRLRVKN